MELKNEVLWPIVHARLREYMATSNWDIETIATGTGSATDTVIGWLGSKEPSGERLIKLWHLLAALGCDSPELKQLGSPNILCGQLLTFGVLSLDELHEIIGVTNPQAVLRMLRGTEPMRWCHDLDELNELYGQQLTKALSSVQRKAVRSSAKTSVTVAKPVSPLPSAGELVAAIGTGQEKLLTTAVLLGALRPLVSHFNSDDCTAQDRSKLRSLLGDEGMFELSNHFNALCSERARNDGR